MLVKFSFGFDMISDMLDSPIYVSFLVGDSVTVSEVYLNCSELFMGSHTLVERVILDMLDFHIILGLT